MIGRERSLLGIALMQRSLFTWVGVVVVLAPGIIAPWASSASAQMAVTVYDFEGRATIPDLTDLGTQTGTPISRADCDANARVTFRYTNVPTAPTNLQYFFGSMCDVTTSRTSTTDTSCTDLDLTAAINMRSMVDHPVAVSDLVDCTATNSGTRDIWVLAIDNVTDDVAAGEFIQFPIAFDFAGPSAPEGFAAAPGESEAELTWSGSTDAILRYEVYFVPNGCTDGSPNTEIGDPPSATYLVDDMIEGSNSSYDVPFPTTVAIGSQSAVAIRSIDRAGNPSALSNVVCVTRIEVISWWDTYCGGADAPDACRSSGCTASPVPSSAGGGAGSSAPVMMLLLALSAMVVRRRNR